MQTGVGQSHAKIILIGEHAVVYGQPAIALPVFAVQVKVTVTPNPALHTPQIKSAYYNGALTRAVGQMQGIRRLIEQLWQKLDSDQTAFELQIDSDLPPERGMGSSAATAIAIIRAFFATYHQELSQQELLKLAALSENLIHGNPSGVDAATAGATTPLWFVKGQPLQPLPINLQGYLVIADSGQKGQTGAAVNSVQNQMMSNPEKTQPLIEHLGQLTQQVAQNIAQNKLTALGANLNHAQLDLQALNVSNSQLDRLITVANQNGSLGSKLTGGGRGGCIIALAASQTAANELAQALLAAGAIKTWIQPLHDF
ncbi:mevalonate kinase [Latilactobacillus graminis]|uniref:Mevalonate kinase n=2 Tax=Latilactobacillus graminis TaxID=60519 RepID=A0AA89I0B3_9LACO|nr:mevalonate kinase [Latilactobacillus graminis]KRM22242.1 mevalonate kinase [Latilactobacillus graminis DSM 20719]QFP79582.1 mevalonate kinase [Latilactobacillus graminis]